jgi:DNA-directed RNA polymerase specialized sigma24 family protein
VLCGTPSSATAGDPSQFSEASRALADRQLVDVLAADDFSGSRYHRFQEELARYSTSILQKWMSSGRIFNLISDLGFPIHPTEAEREEMRQDPDVREGLANITIAVALVRFRERALVGREWRPDGGASLTTYFMSFCLSAFPNEFRRYRAQRKKWFADKQGAAVTIQEADHTSDPATLVSSRVDALNHLRSLDPRTQKVVALTVDGFSQKEIADLTDEPSTRAVEGVMYRYRTRHKNFMQGGDHDE